uniref:Uncharacterized protein n=1 Tax=Triticum urartu TaxID=4572 RepID=A0A8R7QBH4_TRIUA
MNNMVIATNRRAMEGSLLSAFLLFLMCHRLSITVAYITRRKPKYDLLIYFNFLFRDTSKTLQVRVPS